MTKPAKPVNNSCSTSLQLEVVNDDIRFSLKKYSSQEFLSNLFNVTLQFDNRDWFLCLKRSNIDRKLNKIENQLKWWLLVYSFPFDLST